MLELVNESRVISGRRVWIARLIVSLWLLVSLPIALVSDSLAGLLGSLFGFCLVGSLLFAGAYRVLSTEESNVDEKSLPAESEDSGPETCPECDLNLAMGVEECQRCGWSFSDDAQEANPAQPE
jgi:ribosomal protein L37AE/L43A